MLTSLRGAVLYGVLWHTRDWLTITVHNENPELKSDSGAISSSDVVSLHNLGAVVETTSRGIGVADQP